MCFNSRTPCGVRPRSGERIPQLFRVSIHAPRVGCDPRKLRPKVVIAEFQFTHPVWGATTRQGRDASMAQVSIHAPRVGCDGCEVPCLICSLRFNSRTPCGVRPFTKLALTEELVFQFTHPVWGATSVRLLVLAFVGVSIHAPRVGCDRPRGGTILHLSRFNSRTPCGVRL